MHTLLLLCLDYWCSSWPLRGDVLKMHESIGKFDSIGLNIRRFIYFIEYLYLCFLRIDFRRLSAIDIMFMLISWILLLIDWVILWILCIRLWIGLLIVVLLVLIIAVWWLCDYKDWMMKRIQLLLDKK